MANIQFINVDEIKNRHRTPITVADVDPAHAHRFAEDNMTFDKDLNLKGKYCYHPFNSVTIDTRGECYVCVCQAWLPISVGNILDFNSLTEIVHSPKAREIQASILDGTYKYCDHNTCHLIKQNDLSGRISHKSDTVNWIVFAIDDSCNLSCPSCRTELIFFNKGEEFDHRMKISNHITKLIQEHHQFLKFTLSGDGDPFASHVYRNILENLQLTKDDQVEIEIVTNGILAKSHWDRMSGVHKHIIGFKISFDAGSPEVYTTTRRGGDWDKLIESSKHIINWKQKNYSDMKIVANFVVQTTNFRDIHNYVELTNKLGFDEISFQKVVDWSNWNVNGVNYFTDHAVWMESHPDYQELLTILNDPIMRDKKINLNNLLDLQLKANQPKKLSNLVKLKQLITKNLDSTGIKTEINSFNDNLNIIANNIIEANQLSSLSDSLSHQITALDAECNRIISAIDDSIVHITKDYHKRGYVLNGMFGSNRTDTTGEQHRILPLMDSTRDIIIAQISKYASWEYPGLEIGPGEGIWTEHLVACDPLYLVDIHQEFLDKTVQKFNTDYQKRLCSYLTNETNLSMLPQNQIGFVFSWNLFNYLTTDLISKYLGEIFNVLRPGGTCMFSYNNAERYHCAEYVELGFMSYMPKTLLVSLIHSYGFNILKIQDLEESVSWVEIQKPGELTTIKAHQVLGRIIAK